MITFEKAVEIVKNYFTEDYVLHGFEFRNRFVFTILSKDYKNQYTNQSQKVSVDINTGELDMFDLGEAFDYIEEWEECQNKLIEVDKIKDL